MKNKKALLILFLIESIIILLLSFWTYKQSAISSTYPVDLSQMSSSVMSFSGDKWTLENSLGDEYKSVLSISDLSLPKGSYTATVTYECEDTCAVELGSSSDSSSIVSSNPRLEPFNNIVSFHFETLSNIDDFEVDIISRGNSNLTISGINIITDNLANRRIPVICLFVFVLIDFLIISFDYFKTNKLVTAVLFASIFIESLVLLFPQMPVGHDMQVHLFRIESIADGLINGDFPIRMQRMWMGGYGYPISVYYGDWALYFPAVLRLCGFSITASWKLFILVSNIITTVVSYLCFGKIFRNKLNASLVTLAYTTASFRLIDIYVRSSAGEIISFIFLPVVALSIYNIYRSDIKAKNYYNNSILLAIGMSGLLTNHLITCETTCIILFIVFLIYFKKSIKKETIICYGLAVIETILISASFLIPFLDYFLTLPTIAKYPEYMAHTSSIQSSGAHLWQYIDFFGEYMGTYGDESSRMNMTPGLILMAVLFAGIIMLIRKKLNKQSIFLLISSIFVLFLSSDLFPWNALELISRSFTSIQFPWRYIGLSVILLSLLCGEILNLIDTSKVKKYQVAAFLLASLLICGIFTYKYNSSSLIYNNYIDTPSLSTSNISGAEYLLLGSDPSNLNYNIVYSGDSVTFPVFNYPYYEVHDEAGTEYEITNGNNNQIQIECMDPQSHSFTVAFQEPVIWRASEIISLVSVLGMAFYIFYSKRFLK